MCRPAAAGAGLCSEPGARTRCRAAARRACSVGCSGGCAAAARGGQRLCPSSPGPQRLQGTPNHRVQLDSSKVYSLGLAVFQHFLCCGLLCSTVCGAAARADSGCTLPASPQRLQGICAHIPLARVLLGSINVAGNAHVLCGTGIELQLMLPTAGADLEARRAPCVQCHS